MSGRDDVRIRPSLHLDYTVVPDPESRGRLFYRNLKGSYIEEEVTGSRRGVAVVARVHEQQVGHRGSFATLAIRLPTVQDGEYEFALSVNLDPESELAAMPMIPYGHLAQPEGLASQRQPQAAIGYVRAHLQDRIDVDIVRALLGDDLTAEEGRDAGPWLRERALTAWGALERTSGDAQNAIVRRPLLRSVHEALDAMAAESNESKTIVDHPQEVAVQLRFKRGHAGADEIQTAVNQILVELRDPDSEAAAEAKSAGLPSEVADTKVTVHEEGQGIDPVAAAILVGVATTLASRSIEQLWKEVVSPLLKRRLGPRAVGRRVDQ